jgi:hypothetical protein
LAENNKTTRRKHQNNTPKVKLCIKGSRGGRYRRSYLQGEPAQEESGCRSGNSEEEKEELICCKSSINFNSPSHRWQQRYEF